MSLPRMSLHIGDYKRDTGHLRAAEHGAYILLIMHYWATGGLPIEDRKLSAIACMTDKEWKSARETLAEFFAPGWKHKRIDQEIKDAAERHSRAVQNGKHGGRPKSKTEPKPKPRANPEVISRLSETKASLTLTNKEKKEDVCIAGALAKLRPEAFSMADDCYRILGIDLEMIPLEWCGLTYQIDMMLTRGYDPPGILATAAKLSGHKPLKPMNYFIKAVESSQQNQIKPAEKPNGKSGNIVDAADALIERIADFDRPIRGTVRGGEGAAVVRLLPEG